MTKLIALPSFKLPLKYVRGMRTPQDGRWPYHSGKLDAHYERKCWKKGKWISVLVA